SRISREDTRGKAPARVTESHGGEVRWAEFAAKGGPKCYGNRERKGSGTGPAFTNTRDKTRGTEGWSAMSRLRRGHERGQEPEDQQRVPPGSTDPSSDLSRANCCERGCPHERKGRGQRAGLPGARAARNLHGERPHAPRAGSRQAPLHAREHLYDSQSGD